jgi:hypothetical protein
MRPCPGLIHAFAVMCLVGCFSQSMDVIEPSSPPLAPLLGEPVLLRVHEDEVTLVDFSSPLSPGEAVPLDPGFRFVVVGFPIGTEQPFAVDDYQLDAGEGERRFPLGVAGENPMAPDLFYDPEDFADVVTLSKREQETNGMQDELLVSWGTPASVLLLLYEVPAKAKTITLHHGERRFELWPNTGKITSKP